MAHRLIVLPDDTARPILDANRLGTLRAEHPHVSLQRPDAARGSDCRALARRKVRVMLDSARRNGVAENEPARTALVDAGVELRDVPPGFELTHQKSMVVDDRQGFVESLNWDARA